MKERIGVLRDIMESKLRRYRGSLVTNGIIDLLGTYQLMSLIPKRNEKAAMRYTGMTTDEVIRSIGGMTFSDVIPDEKRRNFSAYIMKEFLTSYEKSNFLTTML